MDDISRREFLASGTTAAAATAFLGGAGLAFGQNDQASEKVASVSLAGVIPGATDFSGKYALPDLSYGYDAFPEVIDEQTMRLHHSKHHQGYVNGLIKAEADLAAARASGDYALVDLHSRKAAFHGAGHFLHCVFWDSMSPGGGGAPDGALAARIADDFGGFDPLWAHFAAASKSVEGAGWGILGWSLGGQRLVILQALNHQLLTQWGVVPLLCLDVWEHAYYLKYQNNRGAYVDNFAKIIDWKRVGERFEMIAG